ncbi:hypothetical protein [Bradyrhizobium sp. WD16]|uniref:hypothetical protein n=1 Tax=Bradyrhizobium sp. WD16 TaxID=1521768 RepID=UPI0020A3AE2D|nr:hypothetical protein [Bradyrhizobium sp. WD16]
MDQFRAMNRFIAEENISLFEAELLKQIGPAKRETIEVLLAKEKTKLAATTPKQTPRAADS